MMTMRFVAFLIPFVLAIATLAPAGAAQVLLNEILADPNSDWDGDGAVNSKSDEWVEITNTGSTTVNLGDCNLGPGETRAFLGAEVVVWQEANGVSTFGLSLNNSGDTVYLYRIAGSDTSAVDSYAYGTNQVKDDRSVGRHPDGGAAWVIFDGMNPYTGSDYEVASGCRPSLGAIAACPTPTELSTWGRVKTRYSD
jgi:hypothetical protein